MGRDYKKEALGLIEGRVIFDAPMRRYTSMRVGGPADTLFFPRDVEELGRVIRHARKKSIPVTILGKGTNVIVRDRGLRGWVVSLTQGMRGIRSEGETLEAEAGLPLQRLVQYAIQKALTGLEAFYGIPGTVGGGLAMNAGAWGTEMKDVVASIAFMNDKGEIVERSRSRLRFHYRKLSFPASWMIVRGRFQLKRGNREKILDRVNDYMTIRRMKHPLDYPSAGSVFKNPKEGPAGEIIEELGLKGFRRGRAMVSDRHANFIINLGKATAEEILGLIEHVEERVFEGKGISLEREVKVVGE